MNFAFDVGLGLLKRLLQAIQKGKFSTLNEAVALIFHDLLKKQPWIVISTLIFAVQSNQ